MVFESIVTDLLNRYIGDYVQNLDRKQLKIGIWGGDVVLNNLILKQSALNDLDLPVTTSYGHLGKLVLKIPWKNLYSSPVEAYVENLYLLVVPNTDIRYDAEKEAKQEINAKMQQIERFEQAKKVEDEKGKPKADKSFSEKLTTQIINNVQITINNIHIRYEDNTTAITPFAFGVTLSQLSVQTTDDNWIQSLVAASLKQIFKMTQLEGLSVYINCNTRMFQSEPTEKLNSLFQETIASKTLIPEYYNYILGPISLLAKLQLVPNPEADEIPFSIPKIKLKICMERLAMGITRLQYQNLIQLVDMFGRISRGAKYRKFRPFEITYRNNAREWWLFACECILETEVKRRKQNWSWEHIKLYRNNFRSYAEVYRMILLMKKTNTDMIKQCEELERVLDLTSILFLRQKTELEVKKIEKDNQQIQISHGWFGGWWSGSKKDDADTNDIRKKIEAALTNDEKGKLFDAIGYKENAVVTELPEFFVAYFIDFELHSLEVLVSSENTLGSTCENIKNIMKLKLTHVNCIIEQRPAASAIKIITNINKLTIAGMHQNDFLPIIVQSQLENTKPLLDIMFEKNPADKNCDQRIHVSSLPLQIVYDAATVIELQKIFKTPETTTLSQWQDVAAMKLLDIKERSAIGLQYAIQNHPRLEVNMKLMPSYVLIPSDGKFQGKESILVFGLGKLLIKTEPRPLETLDVKELYKSGASSNEILTEMIKQSYDKFTLEIHSIQAIVASPAENWQNVILQDNITDMHILQPATLKLSAHICVIEDDPRLPKTKIVGEISKIHINVTENRILEAYSIINSLPIQENEDIKPKLLNKESNILSSSMSLLKYLDEKQKTISINNKSELVTDEMSETIQYTVLDIKLVMNELCITMNQQIYSSDSSNDLYKTPTEEFSSSTKQFITLDLPDFQNQQKIVRFKLQQLELNLIQQTYDMRINLMLGAVALDQFRYKNGKESVINVISNPKYERNSDLLFSLSYTDCQKTSPEFVTKHKSTEKLIEIQFSTLLLILHQEALTELIQLFNEFESRIKAIHRINEKPHDRIATIYGDSAAEQIFSAAKNKLPVIFEDEKIMVLKSNLKKIKKQNEVVDSIKIKFLAKMEDVTVNILTDYWELASLEVKNLAVTVLLKSSYTEINLQLQDIIVLDHNPLSIYTKILSIVGDKALNSSIVIFNINETSAYSSDNIRIDLTMGCAKIIFLNRFVSSVLNFFGHFQAAQRKIKDVSTAVAEAAKTNVVEAYTQSNLIRLLIKINAPIIVVPVSSNSLEAILIDLGHLNVANSFIDIKTNDEHPAILDDIQIELKDIKISKINFQTSVDKLNASSDNNDNNHILNPTTFSLYMQRNLSCYWFKDRPEIEISGRLNDIDLNITGDNYNIVMQILSKNLKEGQEQLITITNPANKNITVTRAEYYSQPNPTSETNIGIDPSATASQKKQTVDTFLKFSFQIDSVKVKLLTAPDTGLATIALYFFSIKGQKLVDGSLSTAIVLCDVHLDDTRPKRENKITRFLERREQNRCSNFNENTSSLFSRPMIDIMLNMKDLYIFVDVKVFSFNLILYLDFLLKVSKFFQTSAMSEDVRHQQKNQSVKKSSFAQHQLIQEQPQQNLTVMLHIEQPDIILVEKMDDMDCYALISNSEVSLKVRIIGDKQLIQGEISNFCLYLTELNNAKRHYGKHYVIHPCSISLNGSTPENKGLHLSLQSTPMKIGISPAIIELLNNVMCTLTQTELSMDQNTVENCDYSTLWDVKPFKNDQFWFIEIDEGEDCLSATTSLSLEAVKPELCVVDVPSIIIFIETGSGVQTTPMLYFETNLQAKVNNWSSEMTIESILHLHMSYFNNNLALWEPLIEKIEKEAVSGLHEFWPWELNFELKVDQHKDDIIKRDPTTKIFVSSKDILELTCTKTCLEVLQVLGQSFSDAIRADGLIKPECEAPYVLENDTGMDVELNLKTKYFTLHPEHFNSSNNELNKSVIFDRYNKENIDRCIILPGGKAYLHSSIESYDKLTSELINITNMDLNNCKNNLFVKMCDKKELMLPISRADKRYFPIYHNTDQEPWGIISEVNIKLGATIITLRGILQMENHFTSPINVYCFNNNEIQLIAEILPNAVFNVPLQYVYATKKDFHFSMNGYKVSVQGISWKENLYEIDVLKTLQCDPVNAYEPLYMNVIRKRHEVFHEVTSKCTMLSTYFVVHIRPPLSIKNALPFDLILSIAGSSVIKIDESHELQHTHVRQMMVREDFLDYGEKLVKPGEHLYLPTVKTMSKNVEQHSFIVARLQQYLEKDWSCTTEIPSTPSDFDVWCFKAYDSSEMSLNLGVRYETLNGCLQLIIYSPFWMLNKTGLMLTYRANDENTSVLYHPPEYEGPVLLSFRDKTFFEKNKVAIRVNEGEWCDRFSIDVTGSSGVVTCMSNDSIYQIGVHNTLTHNSLTKQIVFMPYYTLINRSLFAIEVQENSMDKFIKVEAEKCVPFWPKTEKSEQMRIKVVNYEEVTTFFKFNEVQCILLPLKNKFGGINVDVHVTEGAVYVTFTGYYAGDAPVLIINNTEQNVNFWEKGDINTRLLKPNQMVLYAWVNSIGEKLLVWNNGKNQVENDMRKDGANTFSINDQDVFWVSFLDGTQRVLLFNKTPDIAKGAENGSDFAQITQEIILNMHGFGLSLVNNESHSELVYISVTSSGVIWEEKKKMRFKPMKIKENDIVEAHYQKYLIEQQFPQNESKQYFLGLDKHEIDFNTMTLEKNYEKQIRRTFYSGVWLEMKSSSHQLQLHVKINRVQIDNQISDCIYPVVLAPIPPPKSVAAITEIKPFIEMSIVQRIIPHSTVKQFKYLKVLIQEFHVKVDLLFVNEIFEMFNSEITEDESKKLFAEDLKVKSQPLLAQVSQHSKQELKNFYDNLHLGPLKIHISFSMAGSESTKLPSILSTLLQGVGVTLTDINDVVFRLAFFEKEYQFLTQRQLVSQCITHYASQAVKQLYVLVLGLDVIGNPYGLVVGFTKGVEDLFYEPFQGAIQGPGEFAEGVVLGVRSLFNHTVGGAAGAVSKITGAMGKSVAALTFDKDYQKNRRIAMNKKPTNLQEGLARGGKGLVMGMFDGVTGVVIKPISGARSDGVGGFIKGLGQGAVGLVARPTAGVIDFASGSFDALKRATELSDEAIRIRPPRFLHHDGIIRSYSKRDSEGNKYFRELEKGKYASTDHFCHFEEIIPCKEIVILTNYRIIYAEKNDLFGGWKCEWSFKWSEIKQVKSVSTGVEIILEPRESKSKMLKIFGSVEANRKMLFVKQKFRRDQLADKIIKLKK